MENRYNTSGSSVAASNIEKRARDYQGSSYYFRRHSLNSVHNLPICGEACDRLGIPDYAVAVGNIHMGDTRACECS